MKPIILVFATLFLLSASLPVDQDIYVAGNDFQITIEGTSNVHDWEESLTKASGQGTIDWNADGSFTIQSLQVTMETRAIKSSHGSIMDNKTYDALKADANPTITFKLSSPINNIKPGSSINAKGDLKIAGISKPIDLAVKVSGDNTRLIFEGTKTLNMKDFGVAPPTAFMGAMKVGENVVIKFKTSYNKKNAINQ